MLHTHLTGDSQQVTVRLHDEFNALSRLCIERCVHDAWRCAEHLGFRVTTGLVERLARERLHAVLNSEPSPRARVGASASAAAVPESRRESSPGDSRNQPWNGPYVQ
ncbi:hypothetical protein FHX37_2253 [Haloactinospora alba]|uniref:Uncharacterized protein n=1 Tax=Haloactinospora alba TaxID=405555 RepID=A0A543NKF4_9ACTN|nr:hypothetical protein [Haloactinospora alba]TQN32302.1 hypothetical protein FHX37_2253 [Haloactinospora alba]